MWENLPSLPKVREVCREAGHDSGLFKSVAKTKEKVSFDSLRVIVSVPNEQFEAPMPSVGRVRMRPIIDTKHVTPT